MTVADFVRQPQSNLHAFWSPYLSGACARQGENPIRLAVPRRHHTVPYTAFRAPLTRAALAGLAAPCLPPHPHHHGVWRKDAGPAKDVLFEASRPARAASRPPRG
jgi:hypothetical protein